MHLTTSSFLGAATAAVLFRSLAVAGIPGLESQLAVDDMRRHPFLIGGEQLVQISRGGNIFTSTTVGLGKKVGLKGGLQEYYDATVLSNGGRVCAQLTAAFLYAPGGENVWTYDAPPDTELPSIQYVAKNRVLVMQSGIPAKALIFDTLNNKVVKEVVIPTTVKQPHDMFRHVRMTKAGTILVPHLSENKVCEYDLDGKLVWSVNALSPWSAERLPDGNTLIAGDTNHYIREVDSKGGTFWEFTEKDLPGVPFGNIHIATRLASGNTLMSFWSPDTPKSKLEKPGMLELLEVTPDKKVVWSIYSWQKPHLGRIDTVQILDQVVPDENVYVGP